MPNVRESVLAHAVFFDNIIELIPAKHYLPVDEERVRSQQPRRANSGQMSRQHPNILGLHGHHAQAWRAVTRSHRCALLGKNLARAVFGSACGEVDAQQEGRGSEADSERVNEESL